MGLKEIGKRIGDIVWKLAVSGYGCGGECPGCGRYKECEDMRFTAPNEGQGGEIRKKPKSQ
jgi:hypothetical protein